MPAPVATAWVDLVPSAKGITSKISKELSGPAIKAGRDAGGKSGRTFGAAYAKAGLGPIKTMFGGIGKYAVGAFAAVGTVKLFSGLVSEARESAKVGAISAQVIKTTGKAAKLSAKQVGDLATAISSKTGIDDEAIQSGENLLLTFTNIRNEAGKGNDIFSQATKVMTDMSVALGTDAKDSAIQLGKALNDPIKGVTALQRVGVSFTGDQKKQIATLVKHNDILGAQKIILKELNREFGGTAAAASTPAEKAMVAWGNLREQIGGYILPLIDKIASGFSTKVIPALSAFASFVSTKVGPRLAGIGDMIGKALAVGIPKAKEIAGKIAAAFGDIKAKVTPILRDSILPGIADIASDVTKAAKSLGSTLLDGFQQGVQTGDWSQLGQALGDVIRKTLSASADLIGSVSTAIGAALGKIKWVDLGMSLGRQAPTLLAGLVLGLLNFDMGSLLKGLADHWFEVAIGVITLAFLPAKLAGVIGRVLARVPFAGKLLTWAFEALRGLSSRLVGLVGDALGAMGRAFFAGMGRTGPGIVRAIGSGMETAILKLMYLRDRMVGFGLGLLRGLASGILRGFSMAGAAIGRVASIIVKPFAASGKWLVSAGGRVLSGLTGGIAARFGALAAKIREIPGLILSSLGNLGKLLWNAGVDLIKGLIGGIGSMFGKVKKTLGNLTDKIKDWKGPPKTDAKLLTPAGRAVIQSFINGLVARFPEVKAVLGTLTKSLTGTFSQVTAAVKKATASALDILAQKLTTAKDRLAELKQQAADMTAGIADAIRGGVSLTSLFGMDEAGRQLPVDMASVMSLFGNAAAQASHFSDALAQLRTLGLNPQLLAQIAQLGSTQGLQVAQAIMQGSAGDLAWLNQQFAALNKFSTAAGKTVSDAVYGGLIRAADGVVDGIDRRYRDLRRRFASLGDAAAEQYLARIAAAAAANNASQRGRARR